MIKKSTKIFTLTLMISASGGVFAAPIHDAVYTNDIGRIQKAVRDEPSSLYSLDANGQTPIHIAIFNNSIAGLTALMNNGPVNLNIVNQDGETPLVYAIKLNKYNPILFLLQKGSNPYYVDSNGRDALYYVKKFGDPSTKMIFDEVIKYQEEKLQQQKKLIAAGNSNYDTSTRTPPRMSTSKDGKKSAEELIAENAVQRELLGQTNSTLNNSQNQTVKQTNPDDMDDDVIKTNPVKDNGFVYKNDVSAKSDDTDKISENNENTSTSKNKEIEALAAQVEKLTELIKMTSNTPKKDPVDNKDSLDAPVKETPMGSQPIVADNKDYNYDTAVKKDPATDEKIQSFIKLNQTIGNDIPEKYDTAAKGPYNGIYKTQEKEEAGQEKDVIPDSWELKDDSLKDNANTNIAENGEQSPLPTEEKQTINDNSSINDLTLVEPQKPVMKETVPEIQKDNEKEMPKVDIVKQEVVETAKEHPKDIPTMIAQKTIEAPQQGLESAAKVKPLITANESKSIEDKINTQTEVPRSSFVNILLSALMTLIMASFIGGIYIAFKKYKASKKPKDKILEAEMAEKNRDEIKKRLVPSKPWETKKPE